MLEGVLDVLKWETEQREVLDRAELAYTSLLTESLGHALGDLESTKPAIAEQIAELLASVDPDALRRVVTAPETSCRLLWNHPGVCDSHDFWEFLADSLQVELKRPSPLRAPDKAPDSSNVEAPVCWSALGDICVRSDGSVAVQPPILGIAIDAESPYAVCFDPAMSYVPMRLQYFRDPAEKQVALLKTESAMLALDGISSIIAGFTRRFTLVANLLVDEKAGFSSGSTNEYVGRSIFWNAHRESADVGALAEALVHEAIHSLLSMAQVTDPWFVSDNWLQSTRLIESPWTGAQLRIEPFLQACFVWFGLAHFWVAAQGSTFFTTQRVEKGLAVCRNGFLKGPLSMRMGQYQPDIAPELVELIQVMQNQIVPKVEAQSAFGRLQSV